MTPTDLFLDVDDYMRLPLDVRDARRGRQAVDRALRRADWERDDGRVTCRRCLRKAAGADREATS